MKDATACMSCLVGTFFPKNVFAKNCIAAMAKKIYIAAELADFLSLGLFYIYMLPAKLERELASLRIMGD